MKKITLLLLSFFLFNFSFSQNLDDYKYALIPSKFNIFKNNDYYRLNVLAKLYMQKYGFESYLDSETQPQDFVNTNCNKVYVDLTQNNNLFTTKVKVVIKDCNGKIIATSNEGTSKEKDIQVAYNEALRAAFDSFTILSSHKFKGNSTDESPKNTIVNATPAVVNSDSSQLFAQPISNGYQLIDSEPKVILKIYNTSEPNFYIATKGNLQGVFFLKNNEWFFEYYQNDKLFSEKLDVKF
jgi:hypothetical protein